MKIQELMSKDPAYCLPADTAQKAAGIMKAKNTGIVPIVENERSLKLVGVVTDRDLCLEIIAEGRDPKGMQVKDCMTDVVIACRPEDDVEKALELMRENLVRRIPVVDKENKLQGMVSMADLVRRGKLEAGKTQDTLRKISEPTSEASKPRAQAHT
jgi:CBS domain-containing protein